MELTGEQIKAIKAVELSIKKANNIGVTFWDNYGTMTAINSDIITVPVPDSHREFNLEEHPEVAYILDLRDGFQAGNADDPLYFDTI